MNEESREIKEISRKPRIKLTSEFSFFCFCIPLFLLFVIYSILFFSSCAPARRPFPAKEEVVSVEGFDLIPKIEEIYYSQKIVSDIEKKVKVVENEFSEKYINGLGDRIVGRTHFRSLVEGYDWSFQIIDSKDINIFTTLGGKIYISRALVELAESESELAGILAFEIGHVMARHIPQHLSQKAVVQGIILPGEMVRGERGLRDLYQIFEAEGGVLNYFANLTYYPDEIKEADKFAAHNLNDAGFDPRGSLNFIKRILKDEIKKEFVLWIKRNPWTQKREKRVLDLINSFPSFLISEDNTMFLNLKARLRAISPPSIKKEEPIIPEYKTANFVRIPGDVAWTDTALDVVEGQEIYFQSSGVISLQKGNPIAQCGPDGYDRKTMQQPISDRNIGALIGKIVQLVSIEINEETGEEIRNEIIKYFFIGSENKMRMSISGRMFLGINENVVGDNSGEFKVTIYLKKIKES